MSKEVQSYEEVEDKIMDAVNIIVDPIKQTLGPKGGNVLFEDDEGTIFVTNDGVTIAKNISVDDPVKNAILQTIKHSAIKTNTEAGDGTSTTLLLASVLVKGGRKMIRDGFNQMDIKAEFEKFRDSLIFQLKKQKLEIKDSKDSRYIAKIASNNDDKIADDVVKVVEFSGEHGQVILDPGFSIETKIEESSGFIIKIGMLLPELKKGEGFSADYRDVPVLVTDKRLYYKQEAETILKTCQMNGYSEVVIIANDFIGDALPFFITNHVKGSMNILLVKGDSINLEDLSIYLGGAMITDKQGSIVDKLKIEDFMIARRVYSEQSRTIIARVEEENKPLANRILNLKKELVKNKDKESKDYKEIEDRISYLTTGMVTVLVGGSTAIEMKERMYRYEDAINATKTALKFGYLVGGGIAILNAYKGMKYKNTDYSKLFKEYSEIGVRQLAINSGVYPDSVIDTINDNKDKATGFGYNCLTGTYEDLLKSGVIDPYKVTELAIQNSVSIAGVIISSRYIITNKKEKKDE